MHAIHALCKKEHLQRRVEVRAAEDGAEAARDGEREGMHADPPLPAGSCVKQRRLEVGRAAGAEPFVVAQSTHNRLVAVRAGEH